MTSDIEYADNIVKQYEEIAAGVRMSADDLRLIIVAAREDARRPEPVITREGYWVNENQWRYGCSCKVAKAVHAQTAREVCACGVVWVRPAT